VVADDQGSAIGILSERDIVRSLAKHGGGAVEDNLMLHCCSPSAVRPQELMIPKMKFDGFAPSELTRRVLRLFA